MADVIKSIVTINLILLCVLVFLAYNAIRGLIQLEDKTVRENILLWGAVSAGCLAGVVLLVHYIGGWVLLALPVAVIVAIDGAR